MQVGIALATCVCLAFVVVSAFAASPAAPHAKEGHFAVSGRVVDSTTGHPLPLVNVFIAQSTIGAATDSNGQFSIKTVPEGIFELVASRIGYGAMSVVVRMPEDDGRVINFALVPVVLEAPAIEVRAEGLAQWQEDLARFCAAFLGTSVNARRTTLLNAEVLDFTRDAKGKTLRASATAPLEIVNRGLGYRIHAVLVAFSLRGDAAHYQAKAKFTELAPDDVNEAHTWAENRLRTYRGSFRHFLSALLSGTTKEQGFSVWRTPKLYSYRQVNYDSRTKQAQLFSLAEDGVTIRLHFPGFLKVVYILEPDEFTQASFQVSLIKLARDTVGVNFAGYAPDPGDLIRYGRWSYDRMAEQLPFDYVPPR